jgi:lipoate-protein ligase B
MAELEVRWCGVLPFREAMELQGKRVEAVRSGAAGEALLLLEHPPVVTLGRSHRAEHLLLSPAELAARGTELHAVNRGGDITWHGPGQLVGYAVLDLAARGRADVSRYLRDLEAVLIDALADLGVEAAAQAGYTGVFAAARGEGRARKIASIGVGLRGWVTFHGFALNVTSDLRAFEAIVPCGLHDVEMTSVARELGGPRDAAQLGSQARRAVAQAFAGRFA